MSRSHVAEERLEAVSALRAAGPDAPTLCEGWSTRDLAAHLVVRERRPDVAAGLVLPPLEERAERVRRAYAEQDYESLLRRIGAGPAPLTPWRWPVFENALNLLEYFVHTEDVLRAAPGWAPRALPPEREEAIWRQLLRYARIGYRHEPGGVELRTPSGPAPTSADAPTSGDAPGPAHDAAPARCAVVRSGEPVTVVTGEVGELVLHAFGRRAHARVTLVG